MKAINACFIFKTECGVTDAVLDLTVSKPIWVIKVYGIKGTLKFTKDAQQGTFEEAATISNAQKMVEGIIEVLKGIK